MVQDSRSAPPVLVIESDRGVRRLITTVLERVGFATLGVDDLPSAAGMLERESFVAVLRDLNLAPSERCRSLRELEATSPHLLRRTILMTTTAEQAARVVGADTVFSIIAKPFDIDRLVEVVRACADRSRTTDRRPAGPASPPDPRRAGDHAGSVVTLDPLLRFVSSVPSLERLLSDPVLCELEASLRIEVRRTLGALATTLMEAADAQKSTTRSAVFSAASAVASQLATAQPPVAGAAAHERDH